MVPLRSERNFTPSSTAPPAPASVIAGVALLLQIVHGQTGGGTGGTVSVALLLATPLSVAVIVLLPTLWPVARPALLMVAAVVLVEFQLTCQVIFCVLLS